MPLFLTAHRTPSPQVRNYWILRFLSPYNVYNQEIAVTSVIESVISGHTNVVVKEMEYHKLNLI